MGPKRRRDLKRILPFGVFWMVFTLIYLLLEKSLLGDLSVYPTTGNPYEFGMITIYYLIFTTFAGLLIGTFEVKIFNKRFNHLSFVQKLLLKTVLYAVFMILFLSVIRLFGYIINLQTNILDAEVWQSMRYFFVSKIFWTVEIYMAVIICTSLFFMEVSEHIGIEVLQNLLKGKYHRPVEEKRIFMFLDMNDSTTIAEKIGHIRYFELLTEYYSDLSDPIIECAGQLYQYVGDEVIVSWKVTSSVESENCLKCFFLMKQSLESQAEKYRAEFGVVPSFKAGMHMGYVTTGEIGIIKKDIAFSGDVLNVTARMQSLCKSKEVDLLISNDIKNENKYNSKYIFESLGRSELRGRNESIEIFTVKTKDEA